MRRPGFRCTAASDDVFGRGGASLDFLLSIAANHPHGVDFMLNESYVKNIPISIFSVILGLAGLTIAWQRTELMFRLATPVGLILLVLTIVLFCLFVTLYAWKMLRFPDEVVREFRHPVKLNFFPALSIGILLIAVALIQIAPAASSYLWLVGAALHLALTLTVMSVWIRHTVLEVQHINPAWFIPVIGNIIVPLAGVPHGGYELSWFFFAVGVVFWLVLLTLVFQRMIFHHPLPEKLLPTLFVLVAPPAVGFVSYMQLTGGLDGFARVLYYTALFLVMLLIVQAPQLVRIKFHLSWWAYSFPLAAFAIATLRFASLTGAPVLLYFGATLVGILSLLMLLLVWKTVSAAARGEVFVAEG